MERIELIGLIDLVCVSTFWIIVFPVHFSYVKRDPSSFELMIHNTKFSSVGKRSGAPLALSCIKSNGGSVPHTLVGVTRIYPVLYKEK